MKQNPIDMIKNRNLNLAEAEFLYQIKIVQFVDPYFQQRKTLEWFQYLWQRCKDGLAFGSELVEAGYFLLVKFVSQLPITKINFCQFSLLNR
jgi:hypothetical protein